MEENEKANKQWMSSFEHTMEEKQKIHDMAVAEAKKVWPAKFEAVQKSWNKLASDFDKP